MLLTFYFGVGMKRQNKIDWSAITFFKKKWFISFVLGALVLCSSFGALLYINKMKADGGNFTIATSVSGSGSVTISPQKASYNLGDKIIITATPDQGSIFKKWNDGYRSNANPAQIIIGTNTTDIPGSINIGAEFISGTKNISSYNIESVSSIANDPNKEVFPSATGSVPAKDTPFVQNETGNSIERITNLHSDRPGLTTNIYNGNTNGYSTYTFENVTGEYMLIENTAESCGSISLHRNSDNSTIKDLKFSDNTNLCETNDLRWDLSGRPGTEYTVYYQINLGRGKVYKQDVVNNQSPELIYDFSTLNISSEFTNLLNDDHMSQSRDATYRAIRFHNSDTTKWLVGVLDLKNKQVLPGMLEVSDYHNDNRYIPANYAYTDVSGDGTWLNVGGYSDPLYNSCLDSANPLPPPPLRFYKISDLAAGNTDLPIELNTKRFGHSSWSYDKNGNEMFVYQNDCTDSYSAFNPVDQTTVSSIRMPEMNGYSCLGVHLQRIDNPLLGGWFLMSTYGGNDIASSSWAYNQIFLVEMISENQHPRIWRLASNYSTTWPVCSNYDSNGDMKYFAQAFASIDFSGNNIYWGSNWGGSDNLETYKVSLPQDWHTVLSGSLSPITITMPSSQNIYRHTGSDNIRNKITLTPEVSGATSYTWTKSSGPGTVTFGSNTQVSTTITADTAGTYVLALTANDDSGNTATRYVTVYVHRLGDINNKDGTNNTDFFTLLANWTSGSETPSNPMADMNGDNKVDISDFVILLSNWGS